MNSDQVFSLIRSVLLSGGTVLTSHGVAVSGSQWETIVGGILAVFAVVWSQFHHAKA